MKIKALILAAGMGKRMHSPLPKVLSTICGETLISHVIQNLNEAGVSEIAAVTGHMSKKVNEALPDNVTTFHQPEQKGTAHAVSCARKFFEGNEEPVLVVCGDAPLVDAQTLLGLINHFEENSLDMCVLTSVLADAAGYGRILRGNDGTLCRIVERRDATPEEIAIKEVNSGTMLFSSACLCRALDEIMAKEPKNAQGEYYLTDCVDILIKAGMRVDGYAAQTPDVVLGANDPWELSLCEAAMQKKINRRHMMVGVRIIDPPSTYISRGVKIGEGTIIHPGCLILGQSEIGSCCEIFSSRIVDSKISDNCLIDNSVVEQTTIGKRANIGPYTHLRRATALGENTKVGSFSETKNMVLGKGSKIPHLSYVGDANVGERVNFGCGCVTANYDGVNKHHTTIGDDVFIGCNVNMIAPIEIGNNAFIAAGSTISRNVKDDTFVIERTKPVEHEAKKFKK